MQRNIILLEPVPLNELAQNIDRAHKIYSKFINYWDEIRHLTLDEKIDIAEKGRAIYQSIFSHPSWQQSQAISIMDEFIYLMEILGDLYSEKMLSNLRQDEFMLRANTCYEQAIYFMQGRVNLQQRLWQAHLKILSNICSVNIYLDERLKHHFEQYQLEFIAVTSHQKASLAYYKNKIGYAKKNTLYLNHFFATLPSSPEAFYQSISSFTSEADQECPITPIAPSYSQTMTIYSTDQDSDSDYRPAENSDDEISLIPKRHR